MSRPLSYRIRHRIQLWQARRWMRRNRQTLAALQAATARKARR